MSSTRNSSSRNQHKKNINPFGLFVRQFVVVICILVLAGLVYSRFQKTSAEKEQNSIEFSQLVTKVRSGSVKSIEVKGSELTVTMNDKENTVQYSERELEVPLSELFVRYGLTAEHLRNVSITVVERAQIGLYLTTILLNLLPIALIIFLFVRMSKKGGAMGGMSFGMSRAREHDAEKKQVTFADVAGNREAKVELVEVVDFLKAPQKYHALGAKIPKGVLMTGAPGTGKTLLARAVAGEAGVPFYYLSGSEFVEMFVGVGASRVRDLFEQAKESAPAIVFIDEIDAVGRHRGVGIGGGNDEREQTLNQILVEMDGFDPTNTVIVMAATNRPDVLDEALLRPGRFDRRIMLDLPDRTDRKDILDIHAQKRIMSEGVNLQKVAERTVGFSGAELESVVNEAALLAARNNRESILQVDLLSATERVTMGPERLSYKHTEKEKRLTAYHEAGHAVVASVLPDADPVHKVTIIPRGHAGGYTMKLPVEDKKLSTKSEYMAELAMAMAGGEAERILLDGDVTTGPSGDIKMATAIARNMVTKWGMSESVGPVLIDTVSHATFGREGATPSDHMSQIVDIEIKKIIVDAQNRASALLQEYRSLLDAIAESLLQNETLEQAEFNDLLRAHGITPKE
jgi:cell division protease FtsH